ncbi:hypothetical protein MPSEU_000759300 [Mayamaea pseudoterrestris]|nr:hypothetical protein MPSEU_000759300 [Mayamaea pseudoterrestris]
MWIIFNMQMTRTAAQKLVTLRVSPRLGGDSNRYRSFSSSSPSTIGHPLAVPAPDDCDIVKGPSLLRTSAIRPRPSLLHLPGLRSLPFWTQYDAKEGVNLVAYQDASITRAVDHLQSHWKTILREYQTKAPTLRSDYETDTEHSLHQGTWDWHSYMTKGKLRGDFATHFSTTFNILQTLRDEGLLFEKTPFGYSFFSTLHANSSISAHYAPMNFRVRLHLPLIVPAAPSKANTSAKSKDTNYPACGIRVGNTVREWIPGQALVLDDAFEHQVWNDTDQERVLLLVDLWHPDVSMQERQEIVQLFDHAKAQGFMS